MKIGFDWGGVLDEHGEQFTLIANALKADGHEIYVVSAINAGEDEIRRQQVEALMPNVAETITLVAPPQLQPDAKLKIIKDEGIDWFFDDRADICELLQRNGVLAFVVPRMTT